MKKKVNCWTMRIDYINMLLGMFIIVAGILLFWNDKAFRWLFPCVFVAACMMNYLNCYKQRRLKHKFLMWISAVAGTIFLGLGTAAFIMAFL